MSKEQIKAEQPEKLEAGEVLKRLARRVNTKIPYNKKDINNAIFHQWVVVGEFVYGLVEDDNGEIHMCDYNTIIFL